MENLLKKLREQNIIISLEKKDLKVKFNGASLPAELLRELKDNKEKLVKYLSDLEAPAESSAIQPLPQRESYPLSSSQSRVWVLSQFEGDSHAYNMPGVYLFEGNLDIEALEDSFKALMARHEILRTTFKDDALGEIRQFVYPAEHSSFELPCRDLRDVEDQDLVLKDEVQAELTKPFDLSSRPLLRASLYQLADKKWVFVYVMHHIVSDGWSMEILFNELLTFYNAFIKGETPVLRPLRIQYKDYAFWQNQQLNGTSLQLHKSFWLEQMEGGLPVLALPGDNPRPAVKNYRGGAIGKRISIQTSKALKSLCQQQDATLFMGLMAAVNILFYRYTGQEDMIIGTPTAGRDHIDLEDQIGLYLNTLPLRTKFKGSNSFEELLANVRKTTLAAFEHQIYPFERLVEDLQVRRDMSRSPLFDVMVMLQNANVRSAGMQQKFGDVKISGYQISEHQVSKMDMTFDFVEFPDGLQATIEYNSDIYNRHTALQLLDHLEQLMEAIVAQPSLPIQQLEYLKDEEREKLLQLFNQTSNGFKDETIVALFEKQVSKTPDAIALVAEDKTLTYHELHEASNRVANYLRSTFNVQANDLVGLKLERSEWLLISLLGVLKSGAAYVPIDPGYPQERIDYILNDSNCVAVLDERIRGVLSDIDFNEPEIDILPQQLAYCIYTSGTTGNPKGCLLTHRNVVNFFRGMNKVFTTEPGTLLALTNYTFDISVLELVWTLTNGYKVVLQRDVTDIIIRDKKAMKPLEFSLFYFGNADAGNEKYKLLLDGAKYADEHGYVAVWTPERHFHEFGGLYPNPSVMGAALAATTKNVAIRAGSVVVPLHHPLRIAEEWSVVDNLSGGRVAIACASGWHASDFVLSPGSYAKRHEVMYQKIDMVKKLWKGEAIEFEDGKGTMKSTKIFPRPCQQELPIWITSANSIDTFISAGKLGANVLTHLLGETVEGLAVKIAAYRKAYAEGGHDVSKAKVSLMLHTYIDEDIDGTYAKAKAPFKNYLRTSVGLMKSFAADLNFNLDDDNFSAADMDSLLEYSFNRYVSSASLIGTRNSCFAMLEKLGEIGVDEIACLIDFGIEYSDAMRSLNHVTELRDAYNTVALRPANADYSVHGQLKSHNVTHLQCTPSLANLLRIETAPLQSLKKLLLGGERVPLTLVKELHQELPRLQVYNMYGPTETTIWSTCTKIERSADKVLIGKPIANTQIYILDANQQLLPLGAEGEIYIGGKGVAKGYLNKPELTGQRFIANPFIPGERLYRTGDFGRWLPDGNLEYSGRRDDQVKLHGHRIELAEIETALLETGLMDEVVVLVKESASGEKDLIAWFVAKEQVAAAQIRDVLRNRLPAYMVPARYVQLTALPLTPNGKVDRKKILQEEIVVQKSGEQYVAAANEIERKLVEIWSQVLEVETVGATDNFFDLGGNSIKIVRMVMLCNRVFDKKLTVAMAFRFVNIQSLAEYLSATENMQVGESEEDMDRSVNIMEETFSLLNENAHEE